MGLAMFLAAGLASARAEDCPPLAKIASVKLQHPANSSRIIVPVTINGVPKKFLLDTAGLAGLITKEAADELNLWSPPFSSLVKEVKTVGLGDRTFVLAETISNDSTLISAKNPTDPNRDSDIDGTLVNTFLLNHGEMDLDFAGGTLNLFSPEHCPGKINYWGAQDIDYLPLSDNTIEIGRLNLYMAPSDIKLKFDIGHLTVPVMLDGHSFNGWIDTSAEHSSISLEAAERIFNLHKSDLGPASEAKMYPAAILGFVSNRNGQSVISKEVYHRKFSTLSVGHIGIKNLDLLIAPDREGRNNDWERVINYAPQIHRKSGWNLDVVEWTREAGIGEVPDATLTNSHKDAPDMVLGMDVLRHLHIYLSPKEKRMYFSVGAAPSSTPGSAAATK
ncbi:MAG TPA: pepsin/retropepsin-like aspartic protease family protein [Rhizomicrobium sp.]